MDRMEINNPLGDKPVAAEGNAALFITKISYEESGRKAGKCPLIFMWAKNYNPIQDMVSGERWDKPYELVRPHLHDLLKACGIKDAENATFSWSQKAGCNCGCSPGFRVRNFWTENDFSIEYEVRDMSQHENKPQLAGATN